MPIRPQTPPNHPATEPTATEPTATAPPPRPPDCEDL
jgi:hypothetical protein